MPSRRGLTVVELSSFIADAKTLMTHEEVQRLIYELAHDPEAGDVMVGTGGVRKVRFAVGGRGKSGGVRVVYYYRNDGMPLFLLTVFGKNEKANLSKEERNTLAKLVDMLVAQYGGKRR
jgi:hypothetical protein